MDRYYTREIHGGLNLYHRPYHFETCVRCYHHTKGHFQKVIKRGMTVERRHPVNDSVDCESIEGIFSRMVAESI